MKRLLFMLLFITVQVNAQSVDLSNGQWIRVAIKETGVYKIDKAFLSRYAPDFARTDPDRIRVYTGSTRVLPQKNNTPYLKGLKEVPTVRSSQSDKWRKSDYIEFYAFGPDTVFYENNRLKHELHPYSQDNYYFITLADSPAKEVKTLEKSESSNLQDHLPYYHYEDLEKNNLLQSGRLWLGDFFNSQLKIDIPQEGFVSDFRLDIELAPIGRIDQSMKLYGDGTLLQQDLYKGTTYNSADNLARYNRIANLYAYRFDLSKPISNLEVHLSSESVGTPGAYLSYWSASYNRLIKHIQGRQVRYHIPDTLIDYNLKINQPGLDTKIWQIINPFEILEILPDPEGVFSIKPQASSLILFDQKSLLTPRFVEKTISREVSLSIFPEMLVIFPEAFRNEAEILIQYKREKEGMEIMGYSTQEIYNHYSSGKTDPSAIRNLNKELYDASEGKLKFLLLLGDASYDYKNNNQTAYVNADLMVPTYQSRESLEPIYSYSSDDYYGFLKDGLGEWPEGYSQNNRWISTTDQSHILDIAIGRIPAKNRGELSNYINKYIAYRETIADKPWQNKIAFVADNRDFNTHQRDSETLDDILAELNPAIITDKLYLDDYPMEEATNGYTSPLAKEKLDRLIQNGTFLITYNGHGAEDGLTNEKLLTIGDIVNTHNQSALPIWLTATCAFGRFDNPSVVSAGELSLLKPDGGAIAQLTTTRAVFSNTNLKLNKALFENINKAKTLGELFVLTKNGAIHGEINRNFTLLGDPSLPLPNWNNNFDLTLSKDTVYALEPISFHGISEEVETGKLLLTVLDKPDSKTTLGTFPDGPAFTYQSRSDIIFQGTYEIENHQFSGDFTLPLAQVSGEGEARIVLSAHDTYGQTTLFAYHSPLVIVSDTASDTDQTPGSPVLKAYLEEGSLIWDITDPSGINLSSFDPDYRLQLNINEYIIPDILDYYYPGPNGKSGRIFYPIDHLETGTYTSGLFASNIYNNTSRESFLFEIEKPELKLVETKVFPNPANDYLNLSIIHNRKGDNFKYKLLFYDLKGSLIDSLESSCKNCPETILITTGLSRISLSALNISYKLIITSETDNQIVQTGGLLNFWK